MTDDGWGGPVDVQCIFASQLESLEKYVSQFKWQYEGAEYDMDLEVWISNLVSEYMFNKKLEKAKKKGITFKLLDDGKDVFRTLNTLDLAKAKAYLDSKFANNYQLI